MSESFLIFLTWLYNFFFYLFCTSLKTLRFFYSKKLKEKKFFLNSFSLLLSGTTVFFFYSARTELENDFPLCFAYKSKSRNEELYLFVFFLPIKMNLSTKNFIYILHYFLYILFFGNNKEICLHVHGTRKIIFIYFLCKKKQEKLFESFDIF